MSRIETQILIKFHPQNLDQASTSKSQPNISISTKLYLIFHGCAFLKTTKLQNLDQNLASESQQRLNFMTVTKHQ